MDIINVLQNVFSFDNKRKSFQKGEKFECYAESFFPNSHYTLLEKAHNYKANNKRFIESSLNPDFKFRDKQTKREFYLESKYRSDLFKGKLEWCKNMDQLNRYRKQNFDTPVFILIGFRGKPSRPEHVFLIPLDKIQYTGLYLNTIEKYAVEFERVVSSRELWNR